MNTSTTPQPTSIKTRPTLNVYAIPAELKAIPTWFVWKIVKRGGKETKLPVNVKTLDLGSSTDPATYATFEAAHAVYNQHRKALAGIGFCFTEEYEYAGVDLDDCIGEDGAIKPWAQEIIDALDCYTEISPSGAGVKIFIRCRSGLADGDRKRKGKIEMYTSGRFFTVTGEHLIGTPTECYDRTEEFFALHKRIFGEEKKTLPANLPEVKSDAAASIPGDDRIIRKVKADPKYARLWDGDIGGYTSQSEADLSLMGRVGFFVAWRAGEMERIFGQSRLAARGFTPSPLTVG